MAIPTSSDQPRYSPFTGLVYIFNLIVGTGALTLPAAFHDAGWLLSTIIIILLAFMSYLTATFVIESMACANAIVHHRRIQRLKKSSTSEPTAEEVLENNQDDEVIIANPNSGRETPSNFHYVNGQTDDESEPLLSDGSERVVDINLGRTFENRRSELEQERFYSITEIFEMGKMASLFFNKGGRILFYLCLTIYLYGDLAIYGAAVAKSLRDVMCTFTPANVSKNNSKSTIFS